VLAFAASCAGATPQPPAVGPAANELARLELALDFVGHVVGPLDDRASGTLVVAFASWCSHGRHELSIIAELSAEARALRVIGVNAYETFADRSDRDRLAAFLASGAPWLRVVAGDDTLLASLGGVPKIPAVLVYDRTGRLVASWRGTGGEPPPDLAALRAAVAGL
jgi:thiol-disulfide isomerase/thioredoxin